MNFSELKLCPEILKALDEKGYEKPSPIQAAAIPAVLEGSDLMAAAQTGTGKTAGFTLPMLELLATGQRAKANKVRALIIAPTRELAAQVGKNVEDYSRYLPLSSAVVFGGVKINPQMMKLRKGVDVLVATPGRLLDLYQQNAIRFDQVEMLVLDEADRMLDMGFIHDIKKILRLLPVKRQNLLFSATFSPDIRELAKGLVIDPVEISVSPANTTVDSVEHSICPVDKAKKAALLIALLKEKGWFQVLVFCRTKHGANKLTKKLDKQNISAAAIHGNKSQGARTKALAQFKENKIQVLVATDIAARGIDISELPYVVNFDLPHVPEDYVHRIGRTGRAGAQGEAVSLVCAEEFKQLAAIERLIGQIIPRNHLEGFEPTQALPDSNLKKSPGRGRSSSSATAKPKRKKSRHPIEKKGLESNAGEIRSHNNKPKRKKKAVNRSSQGKQPDNSESGNTQRGNAQRGNAQRGNAQSGNAKSDSPKKTNRPANRKSEGGSRRGEKVNKRHS